MDDATKIVRAAQNNLVQLSMKRPACREDQRRERQVKKQRDHLLDDTVWNSDWQRKKELVRSMLMEIYTARGKPGVYICFTAATFGRLGRLDGQGRKVFLAGFKEVTSDMAELPSLLQLTEKVLDERVDELFNSLSSSTAGLHLLNKQAEGKSHPSEITYAGLIAGPEPHVAEECTDSRSCLLN